MASCLLLLAIVAAASAMTFEQYVAQHGKTYAPQSAEWHAHKAVFAANVAIIEQHNSNPNREYEMAINQFTDMSVQERKAFLGHRNYLFSGMKQVPEPIYHTPVSALPDSVDWRTKGVVTPVKNQGQCGSCWAFATTETLESHAALSTNPPTQIILSPQQLVNCVPNPKHCGGTGGCSGATPEVGYTYLATSGGQTTEKYYPYTARDGPCKYNQTTTPPAVSVTGYTKIASNNYTAVMNAIATIGPIAITVEADTWFSYSTGILPVSGCSQTDTDLDHNVQLVGYGTEAGKGYWIVRNSWGPTWGEQGYIRLARTADGQPCTPDKHPGDGSDCEPYPAEVTVCGTCGILYDTCYPVGVKIL